MASTPSEYEEVLIDLGVARDQGDRPTCLSFAMSDLHQCRIAIGEWLSPEALHRAAAVRNGSPASEAVSIDAGLAALAQDGQTTEAAWPYNSEFCADPSAEFHKRDGKWADFGAKTITNIILGGSPLVVVIDIGEEFFVYSGLAPICAADALPIQACHAVLISGFRRQKEALHFMVRNSWGSAWGLNGNAWVSVDYLHSRVRAIVRLD